MEARKLSLSFGLLALVALHAFLLRAPLPNVQYQSDSTPQSFSFDRIERNFANPAASRVNAAARDEVKRQQPGCIDCQKTPQQTPQSPRAEESKGQSKPVAKFHNLDIFVNNDAQSKAVLGFFNSYPALRNTAASCNYQVYGPGDELYKQRYSQWIPTSQFPAILLTRLDGGHIYIASKGEIPATAAGLHAAMYSAEQSAIKAEQLAKQVNSVESSPDCIDGNCKKPPFFNRDRNDESSLFPSREPDPTQLITSFFRSQGIGVESAGLLVIAIFVIFLILKQR